MKLSLLLLASLTMVACQGKKSTSAADKLQRTLDGIKANREAIILKAKSFGQKQGMKCLFVSETEKKDIFLEIKENKEETLYSVYEYVGEKIKFGAEIEGLTMYTFTHEQTVVVEEGQQNFLAKGVLLDSSKDKNAIFIDGKLELTLDEGRSGKLEQISLVSLPEGGVKKLDPVKVADIESCELTTARL